MIFERDEFDVGLFNNEFNHLYDANKTMAQLIKQDEENYQAINQGDFLGVSGDTYPDKETYIEISLFSDKRKRTKLEKAGLISAGQEIYTAYLTNHLYSQHNVNGNDQIRYRGKIYSLANFSVAEKSSQDGFVSFDCISS